MWTRAIKYLVERQKYSYRLSRAWKTWCGGSSVHWSVLSPSADWCLRRHHSAMASRAQPFSSCQRRCSSTGDASKPLNTRVRLVPRHTEPEIGLLHSSNSKVTNYEHFCLKQFMSTINYNILWYWCYKMLYMRGKKIFFFNLKKLYILLFLATKSNWESWLYSDYYYIWDGSFEV